MDLSSLDLLESLICNHTFTKEQNINMYKLVLVRHGQSLWNSENRFTGWFDIDLSDQGKLEAKQAGNLLKDNGLFFDLAYTSVLKRAIHTLWIILDILDQPWLPVNKHWRLNERHYGALQGLNKDRVIEQFGNNQVKKWRRSFDIAPPKISCKNDRFSGYDIRYKDLVNSQVPDTESLKSTMNRLLPLWNKYILPNINEKKRVLIVAHGNSLRSLLKYIGDINEDKIIDIEIPTGTPLICELENRKLVNSYYLS